MIDLFYKTGVFSIIPIIRISFVQVKQNQGAPDVHVFTCVYYFGHSTSVLDEQHFLDLASCVILVRIYICYLKFFPTFILPFSCILESSTKGCTIPLRPHPLFSLINESGTLHQSDYVYMTMFTLCFQLPF